MGKRIRVQRRGGGSSTFRARTHNRISPARYLFAEQSSGNILRGLVKELPHESGRGSPLARIDFGNGKSMYTIASENVSVGQEIELGGAASSTIGNILPLGQMSLGSLICNLELLPGDGGKIVRASGTYATIVAHSEGRTLVKLPSGKSVNLLDKCLATLGVVSGGGRTDKPFAKAGKRWKWMKAKGRVYPTTKGIAMNAAFHPHGGGSHTSSSLRPTTVSRTAPPGQKVGLIAARQAGRSKRRA
jgi:large subunit ribosomal protein L2